MLCVRVSQYAGRFVRMHVSMHIPAVLETPSDMPMYKLTDAWFVTYQQMVRVRIIMMYVVYLVLCIISYIEDT